MTNRVVEVAYLGFLGGAGVWLGAGGAGRVGREPVGITPPLTVLPSLICIRVVVGGRIGPLLIVNLLSMQFQSDRFYISCKIQIRGLRNLFAVIIVDDYVIHRYLAKIHSFGEGGNISSIN